MSKDSPRPTGARLPAPVRSAFEERVSVHQLRVFRTVVDQRSFTRAAACLHLSQPAVSHQLKALSDAVGAALLDPPGRRVQLTEVGSLLYAHAVTILGEFEAAGDALDDLYGLRRGVLRVAGDTTVGIYVLPDVVGAFKERHPAIDVRLAVANRARVSELLLGLEADFGVIGRLGARETSHLEARPFLANELVALAARGHPLASEPRITIERLAAEPLIYREPGSGTRETTEEAFANAGCQARIAMELASNGAIKRAVARGLGVGVLSRYAVSLELRLGLLVELPVTGFPLRRQWHLVHVKGRRHGPVGDAFLAFLEDGSWRATVGEALTFE